MVIWYNASDIGLHRCIIIERTLVASHDLCHHHRLVSAAVVEMVGDILIGDPPGNFGADKRFHLNFTQGCHLILMYSRIPEIKEAVLPVNLTEVPVGRLPVGEAPDVETAEERVFDLGPWREIEFKIML